MTPDETTSSPRATRSFTPGTQTPSTQGVRTLTGTLEEGVEVGCLLLVTDDGPFLLLGAQARALSAASASGTVTVTGTEQPDLATTCQQGTPFVVASVVATSTG